MGRTPVGEGRVKRAFIGAYLPMPGDAEAWPPPSVAAAKPTAPIRIWRRAGVKVLGLMGVGPFQSVGCGNPSGSRGRQERRPSAIAASTLPEASGPHINSGPDPFAPTVAGGEPRIRPSSDLGMTAIGSMRRGTLGACAEKTWSG